MKRQTIQTIAFVSLVAYAAMVLAVQAAHWIPGWGCACHSVWQSSYDATGTDASRADLSCGSNGLDTGDSPNSNLSAEFGASTPAPFTSKSDCLLCNWFSMAQQQVSIPARLAVDLPVHFTGCALHHHAKEPLIGISLPRGPPLS